MLLFTRDFSIIIHSGNKMVYCLKYESYTKEAKLTLTKRYEFVLLCCFIAKVGYTHNYSNVIQEM